ncbi:MAG: Gldg family protein [Candidatus Electryoneaceae bacterium]|nr:Gldg family protein [Candidatus Electryoneaceae bacterium]
MNLKNADIFAPVSIILIVANLIVFNMLSTHWFGRIDMTENKMYTLSDVTKDVLSNLEEPLTVKAFFTRDLPPPYNGYVRYVEDQLSEMKAYGKGRFRYEFLDPSDEETLKEEAQQFRIQPLQVQEVQNDQITVKEAYLGMVLLYEDRQEVIPIIQLQEQLEYDMISKIIRVTRETTPAVGFLTGHGEPTIEEGLTGLNAQLGKMYDVKPVDLSTRYTVPDDIDLLCIIGPTEDIPEKDQFAVDQYLMRGGKLFICANKVGVDLQTMQVTPSPLQIDDWTRTYGFKFIDQLVMDQHSPVLVFGYGRQQVPMRYPFFPKVMNFNRDNVAMKSLRQVALYFPGGIDTSLVSEEDSLTMTTLFWSSERSDVQIGQYDTNPMTLNQRPTLYDRQSIPLGVLVQGKFPSYWRGKQIPIDEEGNPVTDEPVIPLSQSTRIIAISDGNFINDSYLSIPDYSRLMPEPAGPDNLTMVLNLIDWLVQDESLISIRSRTVTSRPLEEISDGKRRTVKYLNLLLPPLLVIGFGLFRWQMRRTKRRSLMEATGLSASNKTIGVETIGQKETKGEEL